MRIMSSFGRTETIMKFCLHEFRVSHLLHYYTLRKGLGMAKLFMDMTENEIIVNSKVGATCINCKQITSSMFTCIKLIQV